MTLEQHIKAVSEESVKAAFEEQRKIFTKELLMKHLEFNVTVGEFAKILGMRDASIYIKIDKGRLPFKMQGGTYMIDVKEVRDNLHDCRFDYSDTVAEKLDKYIEDRINEKL